MTSKTEIYQKRSCVKAYIKASVNEFAANNGNFTPTIDIDIMEDTLNGGKLYHVDMFVKCGKMRGEKKINKFVEENVKELKKHLNTVFRLKTIKHCKIFPAYYNFRQELTAEVNIWYHVTDKMYNLHYVLQALAKSNI